MKHPILPLKINELRTNNYIINRKNKIVQITPNHILAAFTGTDYYAIPITTEIILQLGFTQKNHTWKDGSISKNIFVKDKYFISVLDFDGIITLSRFYHDNFEHIKNIKFVHELQNGWHFLTGEELIFQEEQKTIVFQCTECENSFTVPVEYIYQFSDSSHCICETCISDIMTNLQS